VNSHWKKEGEDGMRERRDGSDRRNRGRIEGRGNNKFWEKKSTEKKRLRCRRQTNALFFLLILVFFSFLFLSVLCFSHSPSPKTRQTQTGCM
jgi:hypothetical protein